MHLRLAIAAVSFVVLSFAIRADDDAPKGLRVFTCGHSFHVFVPAMLNDIAKGAGIKDHVPAGLSSIGGSRVIQHWNVADDKNKAKEALTAGKVDVLTLSPIYPPDDGIDKFVELALKHNPKIRITIQQNWLPFDLYEPTFKQRPAKVDRNAAAIADLKKAHATYFQSLDKVIMDLNQKFEKEAVFAVPVGQAVLRLREKVAAGEVPGIKEQADLFTDAIGHAKAPIMVLNGYCHYAVIYRRHPIGLPVPAALKNAPDAQKLTRILQDIAWDAVSRHPLSGIKVEFDKK